MSDKERQKYEQQQKKEQEKREKAGLTYKVSGLDNGKEIEYWTDESGAEEFYKNQQALYASNSGVDFKASKDFYRAYERRRKELEKNKELTGNKTVDKERITADVMKSMSSLPVYNNKSNEDLLAYYGISFDAKAAPTNTIDSTAELLRQGLSASGREFDEKDLNDRIDKLESLANMTSEQVADAATTRSILIRC